MDAQLVLGAIGAGVTVGTAIVAVAVHASRTRTLADSTDHKVRNLDNWRVSILPNDLNANFARKETIAAEFASVKDTLARIEKHQEQMAARFMSGGAGV